MIPAFHDSHQHFLCYATDKEKINFFDAKSLADMEYLTKKYMKEKDIKKGQWIQGGGWNENNFEDPILPTAGTWTNFALITRLYSPEHAAA